MTKYFLAIDNLFPVEAETETEARDKLKARIEDHDLFSGKHAEPVIVTIDRDD